MKRLRFGSASLAQSFLAAAVIAIIVGSVAVILDAVWTQRATVWYVRAIVVGSLQVLLVTLLVTAVLEQRRKRIIQRTLEMAFLNHHIRNALVEVQLADRVPDRERQHQLLHQAIDRVSAALSRVSVSGGRSVLVGHHLDAVDEIESTRSEMTATPRENTG